MAQTTMVQFQAVQDFSLQHIIHTMSGDHPFFAPVDTGVLSSRVK
jgi:hypothetical protein